MHLAEGAQHHSVRGAQWIVIAPSRPRTEVHGRRTQISDGHRAADRASKPTIAAVYASTLRWSFRRRDSIALSRQIRLHVPTGSRTRPEGCNHPTTVLRRSACGRASQSTRRQPRPDAWRADIEDMVISSPSSRSIQEARFASSGRSHARAITHFGQAPRSFGQPS